MRKKPLLLSVLMTTLLTIMSASQASTYTFIPIADPDANGITKAYGINDSGQVAGTFQNRFGLHGFTYDPIAGYTTLDIPSTNPGGTFTFGINNSGQIAGYFSPTGHPQSYVYSTITNTYSTIDHPNAAPTGSPGTTGSETYATGINNIGQVTGNFWYFGYDQSGPFKGFVYDQATNTYTTLVNPTSNQSIFGQGINDSGEVSGYFYGQEGSYGFVYNPITKSYITLDAPNALNVATLANGSNDPVNGTYAEGINNNGQVVGYYFNATGYHSFVYDLTTTSYASIENPNSALGTLATGINNSGQITGYYLTQGGYESFVATPNAVPIPAAVWLFGSALLGFIGFNRKNPLQQ